MAREKSPAYSWYPKDALSSSRMALMSAAEEGIYRRLLDRQWLDGSIPSDVRALKTLARVSLREMQNAWSTIGSCFAPLPDDPSRLVNERLEEEREKQRQHSEERALSGKRGAEEKWKRARKAAAAVDGSAIAQLESGDGSAIDQPLAKDGSSSSSAIPSALEERKATPSAASGGNAANAQRERVRNVELVYAAYNQESNAPPPARIAGLLKDWNDDAALLRCLTEIGESGMLVNTPNYVCQMLATALRNGGTLPRNGGGARGRPRVSAIEPPPAPDEPEPPGRIHDSRVS